MFEITSIDAPWPVKVPINLLDDDTAIAHARLVFRQLEDVYGRQNGFTQIVVRKEDRDLSTKRSGKLDCLSDEDMRVAGCISGRRTSGVSFI